MHVAQMSVARLEKARECTKHIAFDAIGFNNIYEKKDMLNRIALEHFKPLLVSGNVNSWDEVIDDFLEENMKPEDYSNIRVYEYHKARKKLIYARFFKYMACQQIVATDIHYSISGPIKLGDFTIDRVCGTADFILRKEDGFEAVYVQGGVLETSSRAKIDWKKPENNLFLRSMAIGLSDQYPNLTVSVYSMAHKGDKKDLIVECYNDKPDKTCVSLDVPVQASYDTLFARLEDACNVPCGCDCNNCRHSCVCKMSIITDLVPLDVVSENSKLSAKEKVHLDYTESQQKVIEAVEGPVVALAVPGAGKTRALVGRTAHMIRDCHISPENILLLTFSNKACNELIERLKLELETENENALPLAITFNGLGYRILQENPFLLGREVHLATDFDKKILLEEVVTEMPQIKGYSYSSMENPDYGLIHLLLKEFTNIERKGKESYLAGTDGTDLTGIVALYDRYKSYIEFNNYIDYDEQVSLALKLLKDNPKLLSYYQSTWKYIIIDEFQDTDAEQFELATLLAGNSRNICVVGDDDQSIYGWRGSKNKFILKFPEYFPGAKVISMNDNFRSNDKICDTCNALISRIYDRYDKQLVAHKVAKSKPMYFKNCPPAKIVGLIQSALKTGKYKPGDIAVLARTNKSLGNLKSLLDEANIASRSPKDYIVTDGMFTLVRDILKLKLNGYEDSDIELYRYLKTVTEAPDSEFDKSLMHVAGDCSLYTALILSKKIFEPNFANAMDMLNTIFYELDFADSLPEAIRQIGIVLYNSSHPVLEQICERIEEKQIVKLSTLAWYLDNMHRYMDDTRAGYDADDDFVNLLTAHDAKGKEFKFVIVMDFDEFNPDKSNNSDETIRLAFVALSRAKDTLFITENNYLGAPLYEDIKDTVMLHP